MSILWGKDFVEVRTPRQLFEYSVMVDGQNAQNFVLLCSLDSALPPKSSFLLQLFCQGQANNHHEGTNHSNIDGSCMNVQRDLAYVTRFQSRLRSLKYLKYLCTIQDHLFLSAVEINSTQLLKGKRLLMWTILQWYICSARREACTAS